jgi:uncharacterized protein YneF (UPF0154 family)
MGWFDVQSETVTTKSGRKMHHTKSAVRKRRWSTRKKWLKRLGKAALAGVAAVGLKTYINHLKHKSPEVNEEALDMLKYNLGEEEGISTFEKIIKQLDFQEQKTAAINFLKEKQFLEAMKPESPRVNYSALSMLKRDLGQEEGNSRFEEIKHLGFKQQEKAAEKILYEKKAAENILYEKEFRDYETKFIQKFGRVKGIEKYMKIYLLKETPNFLKTSLMHRMLVN